MFFLSLLSYAKARIAALLRLDPKSVAKYLANPEQERKKVVRKSLLDPFREEIGELLRRDPRSSAAVILQRLQGKGFTGKITILRDYLATVRPKKQRAFIRFETAPGEQCQIDWGHFGTINYGNAARKLSCLAVTEGHSRMLYLEFGHSQSQQALHRGLWNAFIKRRGHTSAYPIPHAIFSPVDIGDFCSGGNSCQNLSFAAHSLNSFSLIIASLESFGKYEHVFSWLKRWG